MKKPFLSLLLLLVLPLLAKAYDCKVDGIYYRLNKSNKTATVTYETNTYNSYSSIVNIHKKFTYDLLSRHPDTSLSERKYLASYLPVCAAASERILSTRARAESLLPAIPMTGPQYRRSIGTLS